MDVKKSKLLLFSIAISPFVAAAVALFLGAYDIPPMLVLKALFFDLGDLPEKAIVLDIRLPRIVLSAVVGISLSASGATLQGIFRNPLVDPYILGLSAGAAFGCALSVAFFPQLPVQVAAFTFSLFATFITYTIARSQGEVSRLPLVLSGVVVSAFFTAMVSIVKFLVDPHKLASIVYWLMGSFSLADWGAVKVASLGIAIGCFPLYLMRWRLNAMSMGEEEAKALGINVERDRIIFVASASLAVGSAVSVSGIIGWVGLMVPHLVRMTVGPDHRQLVPLSMAAGAAFMVFADTLARNLTSFDIPVGIITAICGAPFFIYLMRKGGRESWGR